MTSVIIAAALRTPNARQNVVTVRRRDDLGRSSALISPECVRSKKRVRTEVRPRSFGVPCGGPVRCAGLDAYFSACSHRGSISHTCLQTVRTTCPHMGSQLRAAAISVLC